MCARIDNVFLPCHLQSTDAPASNRLGHDERGEEKREEVLGNHSGREGVESSRQTREEVVFFRLSLDC